MKDLLARRNAGLLETMALSRVLLAFDFDGTLAPISARRDVVRMTDKTARLLAEACSLYPCAVISGRGRTDVAQRLDNAAVKYVVGNHGMEPGAGLGRFERAALRAQLRLEESLENEPDIDVENKRYSLAIHYRKSREKRRARAAIHRAIAALPAPFRVVPGKLIVNVVPAGAPDKGDALRELWRLERAKMVLYVGDDITDEDVFRLDQPGLLPVRVGKTRSSSAPYYIRAQTDIDRLLKRLVSLRRDRRALRGIENT